MTDIGTEKMTNLGHFLSSYIGHRPKKIVPIIYMVLFHVLEN